MIKKLSIFGLISILLSYTTALALTPRAQSALHSIPQTQPNWPATLISYIMSDNYATWHTRVAPQTTAALLYSTFMGGSGDDRAHALAIDTEGNVYVTGYPHSTEFPVTARAYGRLHQGYADIFVAKVTPQTQHVHYITFIGGWNGDQSHSIAVDTEGHAYVTGGTYSDDFPTTDGAFDTEFDAGLDTFVLKLSADGTQLDYSTLLGGTCYDQGYALAVDETGAAHVTGGTCSVTFPTTPGAMDQTYNGHGAALLAGGDAFLTKLSPDGSTLIYSTFLGGTEDDYGRGLALDNLGRAHVTGSTESADFRTTPGAFDRAHGGGTCGTAPMTHPCADAFIVQMHLTTGTHLHYATFLGGLGADRGTAIAIDESGDIYVTGETAAIDFPVTEGALRTPTGTDKVNSSASEAFGVKLYPSGKGLLDLKYSTLIGGNGNDRGNALAVDELSNIYLTGNTTSSDFPTTAGALSSRATSRLDAFLVKLYPGDSGNQDLLYSTRLGGQGPDTGQALVLSPQGNVYVAGYTASGDFPTTETAVDTTCGTDGVCNSGGESRPPSPYPFPLREGGQLDASAQDKQFDTFVTHVALADVLPLHELAPTITDPPNVNGYARATDFNCRARGTAWPNATVSLYRTLEDDARFPIKHLDDPLQRYGTHIGMAHTNARGRWHIEDVTLKAGANTLVAIAKIQGQHTAPSAPVFIQTVPVADLYVAGYPSYTAPSQTTNHNTSLAPIANALWDAGYESHPHVDETARTAEENLGRDWVFYFSGPATSSQLMFWDEAGTPSTLTANQIRQHPLCQLRLVVLAAPGVGDTLDEADNVMRAFREQGSTTVLGFRSGVSPSALAQWSAIFWDLALNQDYTVYEAATLAARDVRQRWYFPESQLPEEGLIILGETELRMMNGE